MGRNWKPKVKVKCEKCNWTGNRASLFKKCPCCGHYYPKRVDKVTSFVSSENYGCKRR